MKEILFPSFGSAPDRPPPRKRRRVGEDIEMASEVDPESLNLPVSEFEPKPIILETSKESYLLFPTSTPAEGVEEIFEPSSGQLYDLALILKEIPEDKSNPDHTEIVTTNTSTLTVQEVPTAPAPDTVSTVPDSTAQSIASHQAFGTADAPEPGHSTDNARQNPSDLNDLPSTPTLPSLPLTASVAPEENKDDTDGSRTALETEPNPHPDINSTPSPIPASTSIPSTIKPNHTPPPAPGPTEDLPFSADTGQDTGQATNPPVDDSNLTAPAVVNAPEPTTVLKTPHLDQPSLSMQPLQSESKKPPIQILYTRLGEAALRFTESGVNIVDRADGITADKQVIDVRLWRWAPRSTCPSLSERLP